MNNPLHLSDQSPLAQNPKRIWRKHRAACLTVSVLALGALASCVAGCATGNPLTRPVITTNEVVRLVTNTVQVAVTVPSPPQIIRVTNTVEGTPIIVTNIVASTPVLVPTNIVSQITSAELVTNYIVNPALTTGIGVARSFNGALNPTPTAPLVDWSLTALGGIATIVAGWQTRKANQAKGEASRAQTAADQARAVVTTVARAVETYPGNELDQVKEHIQRTSVMAGTAALVHQQVQAAVGPLQEYLADGRLDATELLALANDLKVSESEIPQVSRQAFREMRENVNAARGAKDSLSDAARLMQENLKLREQLSQALPGMRTRTTTATTSAPGTTHIPESRVPNA